MKIMKLMALIIAITLASCSESPQRNEYDVFVDSIMKQSNNFDAEKLVQGLPGIWELDAKFYYDDTWETVVSPLVFMDRWYVEGSGPQKYTFAADKTGIFYFTSSSLSVDEPHSICFNWHYDAENHKLVMNSEDGFNEQRTVSGFNDEYLVLDYVGSNDKNIREIFKKSYE